MLINPPKLLRSFQSAGRGLVTAFREEQNFKIQLIFAVGVLLAAIILKISAGNLAILILAISLLLILELINSLMERLIDMLKPSLNHYVAVIKDLMAGAVLVAGAVALLVTILIFVIHLF